MPKTKGKTLFSIFSLMVSLFVVNNLAATPWCNVYDGGWISAPSTCYQGENITINGNTPSADTGVEYMWLWNPSADYINGSAVELGTSTTPTYTTNMNSSGWFIRCARPQGCGWGWNQARETSSQYVSVTSCNAIISAVSTVDVTSCGANNGKLNVDPNVNGGTVLPFKVYYTYNGVEHYGGGGFNDYTNNYVTNLSAGTYTDIRLVDANGCEDTKWGPFVINEDCTVIPDPTPTCTIECPTDVDASACMMGDTDPSITGFPTVSCGDYEFTYVDNETGGNGCATTITRNWTATPSAGCEEKTLVKYDMDACYSVSGNGSSTNYSEFTPIYPNSGGFAVSASSLDRNSGGHSCTYGLDNTLATCFGMNVQSWSDNNSKAIRFDVTLTPSDVGTLTKLTFSELAPAQYQWVSNPSSTNPTQGANNYPTKYGVRVLKNGTEIFQSINNNTTQSWTYESFDFTDNPDFQITETTTFSFEILAYSPVGNGADVYAWDVENIKVRGCTGVSELTCTQTITLTDNLTLSAEVAGTLTCEQTEVQLLASSNETNGTYAWTGPNGFTSTEQNPTTSEMGTHTVVITKGCCTETASVTVLGSTVEPVSAPTNNGPLTCNETTVTLSSNSINNGSLNYEWTGPNGFTSTDANPTTTEAGTYTLEVTNVANGCTAEATTTVDANTDIPNVSGSGETITCSKTTAQLTGASTTAGATYAWTGPSGYAAIIASPTTTIPGEYTLTVTGPNGCTNSAIITVIDDTAEPVGEATGGEITCNDPMVGLVATSTTPNVNYSWNGPQGYAANGPTANAMIPGTYTVTIIGANGCFTMIPVEVTEDVVTPVISTVNDGPLTCDKTTINLTTTATGAISYAWTGPAGFTSTALNPAVTEAGTYTVTAIAANGCTEEATTIVEGDTVQPTVEATNDGPLTCDQTTVILTATSTGAASYSWTGPAGYASMDQNPTVTAAGTYTVIVTASNGCTAEATTTITEDTTLPLVSVIGGEITCNNPMITMNTTTDGVSYVWTGPAGFTSTDLNPTVDAAGTYTVTVTAANGCTETATVTITEDITDPTISIANDGPLTCDKLSVTMTTTSTGVVSYAWAGPAGFTSTDANPTTDAAGTYTVTVTAANGCTAEATTIIEEDIATPNASATGGTLTCNETTVTLAGSSTTTAGVTYAWTGPAGFSSAEQNPTANNAGEYTVTVTAANGCTATAIAVIDEDLATPIVDVTGGTLTCMITSIDIAATSAGAVSYAWTGPAGFTADAATATATEAGAYTVTVTGENGCTETATAIVDFADDLISGITAPQEVCNNEGATFEATLAGAGATYAWDFGADATPATSTNAVETVVWSTTGLKNVTLTVTKGVCTESYDAVILVNEEVIAVAGEDSAICQGGCVQLGGNTAEAGYTYLWTPNIGLNSNTVATPTACPLTTTTYTLAATKNGCTTTASVTVTVDVDLNPIADAGADPTICLGESVQLGGNLTTTDGVIMWTPNIGLDDPTSATPTATPNQTTTYTIMTMRNGCQAEDEVTVTVEDCTFDLALNKVLGAGQAEVLNPGEQVTFTINVFNQGEVPATNIQLVDYIPTGLTLADTDWTMSGGNAIITLPGTLAAGDNTSVDITFDIANTASGQLINYAEIASATNANTGEEGDDIDSQADALEANDNGGTVNQAGEDDNVSDDGTTDEDDHDPEDITIQTIDLELTKVVSESEVNVGDEVTWTITLENKGPANATGVTISDGFPPFGLTYVSDNPATGTSFDAASLIWTVGDLANGASVTLEIVTTVDFIGPYVNTAQVATADQTDIDSTPGNDDGDQSEDDEDSASVSAKIIDLELGKTADAEMVNVGDQFTYTLTLTNEGPSVGTGITVEDNLPAQVAFVSSDASLGSYDEATGIWTVGSLTVNQTETLDITVTAIAGDVALNVAQVASANEPDIDSEPSNDDGDQSEDDEDNVLVTIQVLSSLGDYTFLDDNANGIQDTGEAPLSGVTVNLYDATDLTTIIDTDTTDSNGLYGFDNLDPADDYIIEFVSPDGFVLTTQSGNASDGIADDSDAGADGFTDLIDLDPTENDPTIDAGFIPNDAGLGDYTFIDANQNGIQDAGEAPVGGIIVNLYDATDVTTILATDTTDATGLYQFLGLDPDLDYIVEFVPSDDFVLTTQSGNASDGTADDSDAGADGFTDAIDLNPTEYDPTIDAGFIPNIASLGDYTFIDANENGTQDAGEAPVGGVIVNLYDATDLTTILTTDTTDATGLYGFTQLDPALDYIVEFIAPTGFILTDQSGNASAGTTDDSDADATTGLTDLIDLNPGENDPTIDAGFIPSDAGLGDYTFIDANENGIQDAGEAPVGGVIVNLYDATDLTTILAIDTTDATGLYQFIGLDPALDYIVEFVAPTGFILTNQSGNASAGTADDSDADTATGLTDLIDLNPTEFDPTIDAGFIPIEYDLALIKELADSQTAFVAVDDTVNFTITVSNQGNVPSGDFTILDQLQDGLAYVASSNGGTHANGLVTWELTGLLPGETVTVTVDVLVTTVGTGKYVNWAEISADSGDDIDSTPDDNTGNGFTEPNDSTDNHNDITLDNPAGDEDDNDFEEIFIDRGLSVSSRVFLQGPLVTEEGGMQTGFMMRDDLRIGNYLPMSEPYTERPNFVHVLDGGGETIGSSVLQVEGAKAIVDWVLVELRDPLSKADVLDTRAALLQRDGSVVDIDGISPVNFASMEEGSYHVAIRHRNHLGVMTAEPVEFNGIDTPIVDFTDVNTATYGEHAQIEVSGVNALWAGNTTGEHRVAFQGAENSVNAIFFEVLTADQNDAAQTNYVQTGYCDEDVDIDANAIYQGPNNGPNKMFFNVILHPANTQYLSNFIIQEQLPFDEE